jgi:hypothetical protein
VDRVSRSAEARMSGGYCEYPLDRGVYFWDCTVNIPFDVKPLYVALIHFAVKKFFLFFGVF